MFAKQIHFQCVVTSRVPLLALGCIFIDRFGLMSHFIPPPSRRSTIQFLPPVRDPQVRRLKGISELVKLFNSENQEVQRFATGATRNLIYENMDNKVALIEEGGIPQLVEALKEPDDELRKNITGERRWRENESGMTA